MSTTELRKRLIAKIEKSDNRQILEKAYRLFELDTTDIEVYKLSDEQKSVVNEAEQQIKTGKFLTSEESDKEIDEWLNE